MILVFLGPPGCGKGTQAQYLYEKENFFHLSTGQILRWEMEAKSPLGLKIQDTITAGQYVDDDIMLSLIEKTIVHLKAKNVLFDGFPRTLRQAQSFEDLLSRQGKAVNVVAYFSLPDEILVERIIGRFNCVQCGRVYHDQNNRPLVDNVCDNCGGTQFTRRSDDTIESLRQRLKIYYESTKLLVDYYKEKKVLKEIDAAQSLEKVTAQLMTAINPHLNDDKE